jgi:hypothetical protein
VAGIETHFDETAELARRPQSDRDQFRRLVLHPSIHYLE